MNNEPVKLKGKYYDGEFPVAHPSLLVFGGSEVAMTVGDSTSTYALRTLSVSPRVGGADRFIILPGGGQCQCEDHPVLDHVPQEIRSEGTVAWLEARVSVAVSSVAIIVCMLLFGYYYGLPAAAESVVNRIPVETEITLGNNILTWLEKNEWFKTSHVDQGHRRSITKKFNNLYKGLPMAPYIKLEFRNSEIVGPNAFALPGGTIVITDQMVEEAESDDEMLAILAHETGHVEMRHSMRNLLQSSFIALAAATITADAASLSAAVAGIPAALAQTKYSRNFETEADDFAFELLKRHDISTEAFANIMERLDKDSKPMQKLSYLSTHPITSERVKKAREFQLNE